MPRRSKYIFPYTNTVGVLFDDGNVVENLNVNGSALIIPTLDLLKEYFPKADFQTKTITRIDKDETGCGIWLNLCDSILTAQTPTLIRVVGADFDKPSPIIDYCKMLLMSECGFVIDTRANSLKTDIDSPLPTVSHNIMRGSWSDVAGKLTIVFERMKLNSAVNFQLLVHGLSITTAARKWFGRGYLGDVSGIFTEGFKDSCQLKTAYLLSGEMDVPISLSEYNEKIWGNKDIDASPESIIVLRESCVTTKVILAKAMSRCAEAGQQLNIVKL